MRYLSFYLGSKFLLWIDLKKPYPEKVRDALYYISKYSLIVYISNYKNIFTANFRRTTDGQDPKTSRLILLSDIPKRLNLEESIKCLEDLQQRGKDKKKRKMHENSLNNLKPNLRYTTENHPVKPRLLTDEQLQRAIELKNNGCSWRQVGDLLQCKAETVRTSLRRRGSEVSNSGQNSRQ